MKPLSTVVELQDTYNQLRAAERLVAGIPDWMEDLHGEHTTQREQIETIQGTLQDLDRLRREANAGIANAQEKLRQYQEQIGRVRNQREYGALLQEIDTVKAEIQQLEANGVESLELQEEEQTKLAEAEEAFGELDERYQAELKKWEAEKPGVAQEVESLQGQVDNLRNELSPSILAQFQRLFERFDGRALASVQEVPRPGKGPKIWHCGVCNFRVRPQSVVEIRNDGGIVVCDSCKRILYLAETSDDASSVD